MPTNREDFTGKEVGDCLLEYLLGYGGSSGVFLAQSLSSGEKVAVKIFLPRSTMDVEAQKNFHRRFLREAKAASQLDHPHILSIYSYGQHEGLPYIVMPYMPGGTLSDYVAHDGPLSLSAAQQYLEQIASALDYAHTNGCVHCDVKPANILLDGEGQALLTDFGIVRLKADDALPLRSGEALMGTPDFLSPEQALMKPLDSRSDIYSLAVTLFFLLAGSPPFRADSALALALLHVHEPPPLLGTIRADVTSQIDLVIGKALSKEPEQRYQTAGEFSDAFAEAVANTNTIDQIAYSNHRTQGDPLGKGGKAAPPLEPAVRIKAVWERPFKFSQVAIALIFLLLILAASVSAALIRSSTAKAPSPAHVQPTSTVQKTYNLFDDEDGWLPSSNDSSYFFDKLGRYHIQNTSSQTMAVTWYTSDQFTNFHLQVTASEVASTQVDFYGVVLRAADQSYFYLFDVSALYGGQFAFWRCNKQCQSLPDDSVSALSTTIGQSNTLLSVEATGNTFTYFINGYPVGTYTDSSTRAFAHVEVGLCVEEKDSEVTFSRLQIDKL